MRNGLTDGERAVMLSRDKHLPPCHDELPYRYNNRDNPYLFRDTLLRLIGADVLPYEHLVKPA